MNRIICVAVLALGLVLASGGEAKASGFTFNPGYLSLTGGVNLSWGGGGWTCFNNCGNANGYGYHLGQQGPMPVPGAGGYNYGYGYGYGYGAPAYGYGWGY
jgi:hypothetical protein